MTDCQQLLDNVDLFIYYDLFDVTWHNRVTLNIVLSKTAIVITIKIQKMEIFCVFMIGWSTATADKLTSFTTTLFRMIQIVYYRVTLNIVLSKTAIVITIKIQKMEIFCVFMIGWSTATADKLTSFTTTLFRMIQIVYYCD